MKTNIPGWAITNMFCMIFLLSILFKGMGKDKIEKSGIKSFKHVIYAMLLSFVADDFSRLYTVESFHQYMGLVKFGTYLKYIMIAMILPLLMRFFSYHVYGEKGSSKWYLKLCNALFVVDVVLVLSGNTFSFDVNNIYSRGHLYYVYYAIILFEGFLFQWIVIANRKDIPIRDYRVFTKVLIAPIIGGIMQGLFYGYAFTQMGITYSIFSLYIDVVGRSMDIDYLTGLDNRKIFDIRIQTRMASDQDEPFAAILIDLDDFKKINDTYGHSMGDDALEHMAEILKKSVDDIDVVSRYGGDEFVILLMYADDMYTDKILSNIAQNVNEFNNTQQRPYTLAYSAGAKVYDFERPLSVNAYLHSIDALMYDQKQKHKQI